MSKSKLKFGVPLPRGSELVLVLGFGEKKQRVCVKIRGSVSKDYGVDSHMICPNCIKKNKIVRVEQRYQCPSCESIYESGELNLRVSDGVVYTKEERKKYMSYTITKEIETVGIVSLDDLYMGVELFGTTYEIMANPNFLRDLYNYLISQRVGLLVRFGYSGKERRGIIIPSAKKLLIVSLRDSALIKEPALEIGSESAAYDTLVAFAKSDEGDRLMEFIEMKRGGMLGEVAPAEVEDAVASCKLDTSVFGDLKKKKIVVKVR